MKQPLISVVMPVYNVERYVREAVQSVLDQTYENFELIIVDDGGTDASINICSEFTDPRISIVRQANRGLAGARNRGISRAHGTLVAMLDSDDRWLPDKLMLHAIHLTCNSHVDVSYSGSHLIDEDGNRLRVAMRPKLGKISSSDIIARNPVGNGSAPVIRKTALDKIAFQHPDYSERTCYFDESFKQSEDIECWLRMALSSSASFEGIGGLLTEYRIVSGALSSNVVRQFESWEKAIDKTASYAPGFIKKHKSRAKAYQLRYLARRAASMGDGPFALSLSFQALAEFPRMIIEEPRKTLVTNLACIAARIMKPAQFAAIAGSWTGQKSAV
ncbi:glycosyltransferase [Parasphingorhabdus sp.]|uniref:glycosyltransferase family 2 protein n=1 Tax=Parasphingorhabdus sp. TaxID=2709688 RepID=UPI00326620BA